MTFVQWTWFLWGYCEMSIGKAMVATQGVAVLKPRGGVGDPGEGPRGGTQGRDPGEGGRLPAYPSSCPCWSCRRVFLCCVHALLSPTVLCTYTRAPSPFCVLLIHATVYFDGASGIEPAQWSASRQRSLR